MTGADGDDLFKNIKFEFGPDVNDQVGRDIPDIEDYA